MAQSLRSSRRALLYSLGLGGLGFATSSWAQTISRLGSGTTPLSTMLPRVQAAVRQASLEGWAAAVGTSFTVRSESGARTMTLVSAKALDSSGTRPADLRPIPFALVFEGASAAQVPAGNRSYFFQRSDGSQIELFVGAKVVVGSKAQLVAVLN